MTYAKPAKQSKVSEAPGTVKTETVQCRLTRLAGLPGQKLSTTRSRGLFNIIHDAKDLQKLPLWLSHLQISQMFNRSPNAAINVIDWNSDLKEALTASNRSAIKWA